MATLEDKILYGKAAGYCSSSDEEESSEVANGRNPPMGPQSSNPSASNTGPKGVLEDWRRYKQLQTEQRSEQNAELKQLASKLSLECRTHADDERAKVTEQTDKDIQEEIMEDDFLKQYMHNRLTEMQKKLRLTQKSGKQFGTVLELTNSGEFLSAVEDSGTSMVLIHLYEPGVEGCDAVDGCFRCLAPTYPTIQFCRVRAAALGTTQQFSKNGVPTVQAYKNGQMMANFFRLCDDLGTDFFADDLESYLKDYGILTEAVTSTGQYSKGADDGAGSELDSD